MAMTKIYLAGACRLTERVANAFWSICHGNVTPNFNRRKFNLKLTAVPKKGVKCGSKACLVTDLNLSRLEQNCILYLQVTPAR